MATLPRPRPPQRISSQARVRSLMRLHEAVQKINSILDLDVLLDKVVNDVAAAFGCLEACVLLKDGESDEVVVAAVMGCTQCFKRDRFRIGKDGLVGYTAATGMATYTPDVTREPRYIACEDSTRSELDIPLTANGEVIGVFSAQHPEVDGFPGEQRAILEALARHIGAAIANARLYQHEREERLRMDEEQKEAHRIQQALFPKSSPLIEGFRVDGQCLSAGAVGGDFYDFIQMPDHRTWGLVLADVAGKNMAAALLMSATRGILRSITRFEQRPAEVLKSLNHALVDDLPPGRFVTMIFAVLDPVKRMLTFANAGHPWPIFAVGEDVHFLKNNHGVPLGLMHGGYDEHSITLPKGSRVLLYSDGVSEGCSRGGEEFGFERLKELAAQPELSSCDVLNAVRHYCAASTLADDATAIVLNAVS